MLILVAEDTVRLAETIAEALKHSGYEVLRRLRRERIDVPVLILSAKSQLQDKIDVLRKKLTFLQVHVKIRTVRGIGYVLEEVQAREEKR